MKKKNYLIMSLGLVLLSGLVAFSYAQNTKGGDDKKAKKMEKRIEVEDKNGTKVVTVTTVEDGKSKTETFTGAEAEKFLSEENSWTNEKDNSVKIRVNEESGSIDSKCKMIMIDADGNFSGIEGMDSVMRELEIEMKKIGMQFDLNSEAGHKMKCCYKVDDQDVECIDGESGNMEFTINEKDEKGVSKNVKIKMIVSCDKSETKEKENVSSEMKSEQLTVYPNPAQNNVTIEFDVPSTEKVEMQITDMNGKLIYSESLSGTTNYKKVLSTEQIPNGIYLLDVKQNGFHIQKKVVFNH